MPIYLAWGLIAGNLDLLRARAAEALSTVRRMLAVALAVLGAIGSVIGIVAYVDARASRRVKRLVWQATSPVPVAAAATESGDYKLSILYERPGARPQVVKSADVAFVRFANLGKEPIRRADIAPSSPFQLIVEHKSDGVGRLLDVALERTNRDVTEIRVGPQATARNQTSVTVDFDFLDFLDGAVIRLLTNGSPVAIRMQGDIVGMPQGLQQWEEPPFDTEVKGWGMAAWALAEAVAFAGLALLFRWATGAWTGVWILILPPIIFLGVLILSLVVAEGPSAYKRRRVQFPKSLQVPARFAFASRFGAEGEYMLRPFPPPSMRDDGSADAVPKRGGKR